MSKSLGNFYTLRDILNRGYTGRQIRYLLMSCHYRQQLNFTFEGLEAARQGLQRMDDFLIRLDEVNFSEEQADVRPEIEKAREAFTSAMDDDLNISAAMGGLYDLIRWANRQLDERLIGQAGASELKSFFEEVDAVLGLLVGEVEIEPEVHRLAQDREKARKEKNWALADEIREKVTQIGYVLEDTPRGVRIKKIG